MVNHISSPVPWLLVKVNKVMHIQQRVLPRAVSPYSADLFRNVKNCTTSTFIAVTFELATASSVK